MSVNKGLNDQKKQRIKYSGKAKAHTDKALVCYSTDLNQILSVQTAVGSVHNFKMFKQSRLWTYKVITNAQNQEFDLGFLGVNTYLPDAKIPYKKSKLVPLTEEQKAYNKALSQTRIKIENVNRDIKIFRITKETRRHKQRKHHLFWTLIAGIVNYKKRN